MTVRDNGRTPVSNTTVTFTAPSSGASVTNPTQTAVTDTSGQASIRVAANDIPGSFLIIATIEGVDIPVVFPLHILNEGEAEIAQTMQAIRAFISTRANQIVEGQPDFTKRLRAKRGGANQPLNEWLVDATSSSQRANFSFSYQSLRKSLLPSEDALLALSPFDAPVPSDAVVSSGVDVWVNSSYVRVNNDGFRSNNGLFFCWCRLHLSGPSGVWSACPDGYCRGREQPGGYIRKRGWLDVWAAGCG
ncbi:hypothetical protein [Pseudovibrio brasiliensis]|uniref:Big-1 domain-containing protein n=1 Tax=Pseudovibrio brasiliensis TaxID=1898042 RepID=A0ABX8ASE8_9HYPH|nr:hypothetical protein [Pseudovibrio brasiliensis]QUS56544.1 hypothetical protein KGB56_03650 [Pseudovibrio brasiliensis]